MAESDSPEVPAEKDLQEVQGGGDAGLNQSQGCGEQDKRVEVSHHLERKPSWTW